MSSREMGVRAAGIEEAPGRAVFAVRHRSWIGLGIAGALAACALAFTVSITWPLRSPALVGLALTFPAMFLAYALHLSIQSAAEMELLVEGRPEERSLRVSLRRRWGLLPWSAPLAFCVTHAPQLVTRWETGRTSSKYGSSRDYRRARLVLKVGEIEVPLPAMSGPRNIDNGVVVTNHARAVLDAVNRYQAEVTALQAARGRQRVDRRESRKRTGLLASSKRSLEPSDPSARFLVASTEGAFDARVGTALGAGIVLATMLGLAAFFLPPSVVALGCGGLALPVLGSTIALVSTTSAYGYTHHFRSYSGDHTTLTRVRDLFMIGPLFAAESRTLPPRFPFYVKTYLVGEEESTRHALVEVGAGTTLFTDADEVLVRRFGEQLGGRCIEAPAA